MSLLNLSSVMDKILHSLVWSILDHNQKKIQLLYWLRTGQFLIRTEVVSQDYFESTSADPTDWLSQVQAQNPVDQNYIEMLTLLSGYRMVFIHGKNGRIFIVLHNKGMVVDRTFYEQHCQHVE